MSGTNLLELFLQSSKLALSYYTVLIVEIFDNKLMPLGVNLVDDSFD
jgi:hypothetical protein